MLAFLAGEDDAAKTFVHRKVVVEEAAIYPNG